MRILVIEYAVGLKESVDSHLFPEASSKSDRE